MQNITKFIKEGLKITSKTKVDKAEENPFDFLIKSIKDILFKNIKKEHIKFKVSNGSKWQYEFLYPLDIQQDNIDELFDVLKETNNYKLLERGKSNYMGINIKNEQTNSDNTTFVFFELGKNNLIIKDLLFSKNIVDAINIQ